MKTITRGRTARLFGVASDAGGENGSKDQLAVAVRWQGQRVFDRQPTVVELRLLGMPLYEEGAGSYGTVGEASLR